MKDIKSFLPRVNCKIATSKLREYFQEVDTKKRNEITFDEFVTFYQKLMFDESVRSQSQPCVFVLGIVLFI